MKNIKSFPFAERSLPAAAERNQFIGKATASDYVSRFHYTTELHQEQQQQLPGRLLPLPP